ncbi:MAG: ABC transporter permease [Gammaproteobacteria bacterium]|nr:MAG: ABC transporter permease [Gammaproteobacteria bacterium]
MKRAILFLVLVAVGVLLLASGQGVLGDPHAIDLTHRLAPPSRDHLLGTDHLGRDLATRVIAGGLPSLMAIGIVLVGGIGLGVTAGGIIAVGPPALRHGVSWLAETTLSLPTLVIALVLSALLGAGILTVAAAMLLTSWAPYALTVAALFDRIRGEVYWRASEAMGVTLPVAVRRHMLPNAWPAIAALAGADAGRAVVLVASLGFIGLSADTGRPEWGAMIHEYRTFLFTEPRLVLAPVLACALVSFLLHVGLDRRPANRNPAVSDSIIPPQEAEYQIDRGNHAGRRAAQTSTHAGGTRCR